LDQFAHFDQQLLLALHLQHFLDDELDSVSAARMRKGKVGEKKMMQRVHGALIVSDECDDEFTRSRQ